MNKHIVHIVSYFPPHIGGTETVAKELAEGLYTKGYSVEVITTDIGIKESEKIKSGLPVSYLRSIQLAHTPIPFLLFLKLLKLPKNSLIHLHLAQAFIPEIVAIASLILRIPYITHIHLDVAPSGKLGFLLEPYKKFILKRVIQHSKKVICLTQSQKIFIASKYSIDPRKISVIPNGIQNTFFIEAKHQLEKAKKLLFVGRLSIQKNIPLLIEALSLIHEPIQMDIVGTGEEENHIKNLINHYKLKNVYLHGKKTGDSLLSFYKNADVFILPSKQEGFPVALLEAMSAGLPIIATSNDGTEALIHNNGVIVKPPTPQNFANTILKIIQNKEIRTKYSFESKRIASKFLWPNVINKFIKLYTLC